MRKMIFTCLTISILTACSDNVARAVNPNGTQEYRAVVDGAPALIIDNQTDFKIVREEN